MALRHHGSMGPDQPGVATWDDFDKIDIRVGRVIEVADFPEARRPAWKLRIDFGPELGIKRSSAQITNYSRRDLDGRLVLAVVNFPPRQIGPYISEVLTLGTYRGDTVLLVDPSAEAQPGDHMG
jgi:tRNA-binding protein